MFPTGLKHCFEMASARPVEIYEKICSSPANRFFEMERLKSNKALE